MFKYNKFFNNQNTSGFLRSIKNNKKRGNKVNKQVNNSSNINNKYDLMRVIDNSEVPVVVEFQPSWDLPIKRYNPHLENVVKNHKGNLTLVKLDIDRDYDIVKRFKVLEFPTILGISKGNINSELKGKNLSNKDIQEFLNKLEDSHYK
ncbi:hypothetical protein DICPUDRAFT_157001 [Dictyostelium purpureum]|uniref:Thioredoxin domain-containing protein n=1 Tax=Dictyostelium purpureum TaxID=5786 RepID=F0ZY06_DICPU|nr:uncharacterized protein DICPUDRAFT_157001 [Dictyostelium purpureum]EGC31182.1 hypothetical protein DICPUDRAFT_157001 [Dictyostelium purpureum]|eukprot:XP_003292302.1 hypothetical protein DICPUDRAFT_157001 [Dictyostelium purpureum]